MILRARQTRQVVFAIQVTQRCAFIQFGNKVFWAWRGRA